MRAHGVPKFPDPNASGETYVGNLDPNGVVFQNAGKLCIKETGTLSAASRSRREGSRWGRLQCPAVE